MEARHLVPGGKLYQSDNCAACHGEGGTGTQRGPAVFRKNSHRSEFSPTFHAATFSSRYS
jgi:cytochrome c